jgi:hypothetical protein
MYGCWSVSYYYLYNPKHFLDSGPWLETIRKKNPEALETSEEINKKLIEYTEILGEISEVKAAIAASPDAKALAKEAKLEQERAKAAREILMLQEEEEALMMLLLN